MEDIDMGETEMPSTEDIFKAAENGLLEFFEGLSASQLQQVSLLRNEDLRSPFHVAAACGHDEIVRFLSEMPSILERNLNARDEEGWTPLHSAVSSGHISVVEVLLDVGVDVSSVTAGGQSALHYAASKGWTKIAGLLINHGAKPNNKNKFGCTPLHRAASAGQPETCELLIEEGATVDAVDKTRQTPLMYATICNDRQMQGSSTSTSRPALLYAARLLFKEMDTPPKEVEEELRFLQTLPLEDLQECIAMQMKVHANKCKMFSPTHSSTEQVRTEVPYPDPSTQVAAPIATSDTTGSRAIPETSSGGDEVIRGDDVGPSHPSTRSPRSRRARKLEVLSPTRPIESSHGSVPSSCFICVGSLGITCEIDENQDIVRAGGGIIFRRRLEDLVESYLPRVEMLWRDQSKEHKKYVIDGLKREFGTGWQTKSILKEISGLLRHRRSWARKIAHSGENVTRPVSMAKTTWTYFRRELRSGAQATQQKVAAASRLRKGHTSRLGSGGLKRFRAQFLKDYGRAPSKEEQRIATYHGYKYLTEQYLPPYREEEDEEDVAQDVNVGDLVVDHHGGLHHDDDEPHMSAVACEVAI